VRAIMLMFDSLCRRFLPPYGCDWVKAPNFRRLAERTVTFENAYVGSMPCMPARRELHTGRVNFLHRSWGPLEPFDDSMPEALKSSGIYTHLVSDHYHYWEEGGADYHTRYSSWEISRGQEGDPWKGEVKDPAIPDCVAPRKGEMWRQDWVNRKYMAREEDQPQYRTVSMGLEFLETNRREDDWFLHIETFDPHEPFFTQQTYKALYPHRYAGRHFDWPPYRKVEESPEEVEHCRMEYAALVSFCDAQLGRVLDAMDRHDMWKDTMLIVNTDHGFLLGEHDWWAKVFPSWYNEIAHMPLFIWDPRSGHAGERRRSLVQTIDLPATLLEFFGRDLFPDMEGRALRETIASDAPVREAGLYGIHGGQVNCVADLGGRIYTYMRAPASAENQPLFEYTHMPTHMRHTFSVDEMRTVELAGPFRFTKGCRTMKIAARRGVNEDSGRTMLFDVTSDPNQMRPLDAPEIERRMIEHMVRLMQENDAPAEQYERLGLEPPAGFRRP
jgi:arylsulfatase A-like enzyme